MQTAKQSWKTDESLLEIIDGEMKGIRRVKEVLKNAGIDISKEIITSRDKRIVGILNDLAIESLPFGFQQYQLPILWNSNQSMFFFTFGEPNAVFPLHSHNRDDGFRLIVNGSIIYNDTELTSGDWFYVPAGASYSFKVGLNGCSIFHSYGPN